MQDNPVNIKLTDKEEGIMLTLSKHQGKASIWKLQVRNILYQGVHLFHALPSHYGNFIPN